MSKTAHPLNINFAKFVVEKELEYIDSDDVLYHAFIASQPKSEWDGLDREVVLDRARAKKKLCSKLITKRRKAMQDVSYYNTSCILEELDEAREMAIEDRNVSGMISATMGKAKVTGHVVNRVESKISGNFNIEHELKSIPQDFINRLADSGISVPMIDVTPEKENV